MENEPVAVHNVKDLQDSGKRWLEDLLGQKVQQNQQVFIMVLSPGSEPDETAQSRARAGLEATFHKTAHHAQQHGAADADADAAVEEAMEHVRHRTG